MKELGVFQGFLPQANFLDRVINCQTTHLSRFTLISANLLSTPESRSQVSTSINNIFVYDTFNLDMVLAMTIHSALFMVTGILMWYFVQKYDIIRDKRPMQSFLLYGSTNKAESRPLLYRQRRTPRTLMHRIRHGIETNHALVSCIIDTVEKRTSALANFVTFTMALFIIMGVSSFIVGMTNTTTIDSGKSYTDLNPLKPILWTVVVSTLMLYLIMIVRNYILVERSNFGRVIDVTSGSLSFIFLSLLRLCMFPKSILFKVHPTMACGGCLYIWWETLPQNDGGILKPCIFVHWHMHRERIKEKD